MNTDAVANPSQWAVRVSGALTHISAPPAHGAQPPAARAPVTVSAFCDGRRAVRQASRAPHYWTIGGCANQDRATGQGKARAPAAEPRPARVRRARWGRAGCYPRVLSGRCGIPRRLRSGPPEGARGAWEWLGVPRVCGGGGCRKFTACTRVCSASGCLRECKMRRLAGARARACASEGLTRARGVRARLARRPWWCRICDGQPTARCRVRVGGREGRPKARRGRASCLKVFGRAGTSSYMGTGIVRRRSRLVFVLSQCLSFKCGALVPG